MAIELSDDGTLDTVLRCSECGEEMRYNFSADGDSSEEDNESAYDDFIEWAIEDATDSHTCPSDEPQEGDIITDDHQRFYSDGKLIVVVPDDADDWMTYVGSWCKANHYYPNVWFISDHGNSVLISVSPDGRYLNGYSE